MLAGAPPRSVFHFRECLFHDHLCPRGGTQPPRIGCPGLDSLKYSVWMLPPLPWSPGLIPLRLPTAGEIQLVQLKEATASSFPLLFSMLHQGTA